MSPQAKKALIGYNPISSRIITTRFDVDKALAKADKKDIIILTGD